MVQSNFSHSAANTQHLYRSGGFELSNDNEVRLRLLKSPKLERTSHGTVFSFNQTELVSLETIEREVADTFEGLGDTVSIYSPSTDRNTREFVLADTLRILQRIEQNLIVDVPARDVDYDKALDIDTVEQRIYRAIKDDSKYTLPEYRGIPLSNGQIPVVTAHKIMTLD